MTCAAHGPSVERGRAASAAPPAGSRRPARFPSLALAYAFASALAFSFVFCGAVGCSRDVNLLPARPGADGAAPAADGAVVAEAGGAHDDAASVVRLDASGLDATLAGKAGSDAGATAMACLGLGDSIRLPTPSGPVCASSLAARTQRFALCTCESLNVTAPLSTDLLAAPESNATVLPPAAAVGVNGDLTSTAQIHVGGAMVVGGGVTTSASLDTAGSLRVAGSTRVLSSAVHVASNAFLAGDVSGILLVDGTLHLAPVAVSALAIINSAATVREPIAVSSPCDCGDGVVNLNAALAAAAAHNANTALASADRLAALSGSTVVDIPCGTFSFSAIDAGGPLFFLVHGRALMAITADVALRDGLFVVLDAGAELDLLIGGRLLVSGTNPVASTAPARFRIWVAGSGPMILGDGPTLAAMIYAPRAAATAPAGLSVSGALFARSLTSGGDTSVHFDQAVLSAGVPCGDAASPVVP